MERALFLNVHEVHQLNEIRRISRDKSITDLNKLKERLKEKKIDMKIDVKFGKVQHVSFQSKDFKIDSTKGIDRVFTDKVLKNVEKNGKEHQQALQKERNKPEYNRFDELKRNREERTNTINQNMYNTKGLSR